MTTYANGTNHITTALLLAAGTGSRLQPMTRDAPKCLTHVNGTTILERLLRSLIEQGITHLVVVVGYLDGCIRDAITSSTSGLLTIEYINCSKYRTTNNIYSLWLARNMIRAPFLLVECDLVFDAVLLNEMLKPGKIAVSHMLPWMNGTTVDLDPSGRVIGFQFDRRQTRCDSHYKTVNMYSFSRSSWQRVARRLERHISAGRVDTYYETVLAEMVADGSLSFEAVVFADDRWYEIDTLEDLRAAERLFPTRHGRQASRN